MIIKVNDDYYYQADHGAHMLEAEKPALYAKLEKYMLLATKNGRAGLDEELDERTEIFGGWIDDFYGCTDIEAIDYYNAISRVDGHDWRHSDDFYNMRSELMAWMYERQGK